MPRSLQAEVLGVMRRYRDVCIHMDMQGYIRILVGLGGSKNQGPCWVFGTPHNRDYRMLGSTLEHPVYGNLHA